MNLFLTNILVSSLWLGTWDMSVNKRDCLFRVYILARRLVNRQ